ncbi:hypothetical protein NC651_033636 [Populus alba x Populus x berolinensis]|nr:hypothetical protein NC651_033636 [Populus alba x Populus x berolinensis]
MGKLSLGPAMEEERENRNLMVILESVHRVFHVTLTSGWVSDSDVRDSADELVVPLFSANKLDGGSALCLAQWVSGSFSVHLQTTPTIIVGVDFSVDTIGARFFEGFDAQVVALPFLIRASGHGRLATDEVCPGTACCLSYYSYQALSCVVWLLWLVIACLLELMLTFLLSLCYAAWYVVLLEAGWNYGCSVLGLVYLLSCWGFDVACSLVAFMFSHLGLAEPIALEMSWVVPAIITHLLASNASSLGWEAILCCCLGQRPLGLLRIALLHAGV